MVKDNCPWKLCKKLFMVVTNMWQSYTRWNPRTQFFGDNPVFPTQRSERVEEKNSLCCLRCRLRILTSDTSLIDQISPILINRKEICRVGFWASSIRLEISAEPFESSDFDVWILNSVFSLPCTGTVERWLTHLALHDRARNESSLRAKVISTRWFRHAINKPRCSASIMHQTLLRKRLGPMPRCNIWASLVGGSEVRRSRNPRPHS
jgi:hypothetical protein